jgi:hypothetical protein
LKLKLGVVSQGAFSNTPVDLFRHLEAAINQAASCRGKILSLEDCTDYRGHSSGVWSMSPSVAMT